MRNDTVHITVIVLRSCFSSVRRFRGFELLPRSLAALSATMPVWWQRVVAMDYYAYEVLEMMDAAGIVLQRELGYLPVNAGEEVLVLNDSSWPGHGGNRFEFYVWVRNRGGEAGWVPNSFIPIESAASSSLPDVSAASSSVPVAAQDGAVAVAAPDELAAVDAPEGAAMVTEAGDAWSDFFEC